MALASDRIGPSAAIPAAKAGALVFMDQDQNPAPPAQPTAPRLPCVIRLDGQNRAIVIAESLARVIAAIRIASVRWRSYLPRKHRN